jgi:cytochrome-b5 reductase
MPGSRKVLKPTEFQEFELEEKTVLSHNTAMYAPLNSSKLCS